MRNGPSKDESPITATAETTEAGATGNSNAELQAENAELKRRVEEMGAEIRGLRRRLARAEVED